MSLIRLTKITSVLSSENARGTVTSITLSTKPRRHVGGTLKREQKVRENAEI